MERSLNLALRPSLILPSASDVLQSEKKDWLDEVAWLLDPRNPIGTPSLAFRAFPTKRNASEGVPFRHASRNQPATRERRRKARERRRQTMSAMKPVAASAKLDGSGVTIAGVTKTPSSG